MRRILIWGLVAVAVVGFAVWLVIAPHKLGADTLAAGYKPDLANGEAMFVVGNCSACHATPGQPDRKVLGGGLKLVSPFGTFHAPNISPDKAHGIGGWSELQFVNAMKRGVDDDGQHLYPAFPYASYSLMRTSDVRDLFAFMKTLPASSTASQPHELKFPFSLRPAVGFWKLLYFHPKDFQPDPKQSAQWNRGAYLSEGPAHCSECHTPRNALGGLQTDQFYAGSPNLEAKGRFAVNITPSKDGIGDWSAQDIADLLKTGTDKCFNEPTGMAGVFPSTEHMSDADLAAVADYIHTLAPKPGNGKKKVC
jgi:mono/diheme cytochrome c family protein